MNYEERYNELQAMSEEFAQQYAITEPKITMKQFNGVNARFNAGSSDWRDAIASYVLINDMMTLEEYKAKSESGGE